MDQSLILLLLSTLAVGAVHTLIGPDHYVPFIVLAKARHWSWKKTLAITGACGLGHVLSAVVLGLMAVALGSAFLHLELIEGIRGNLAAWLLIGFGLAYGLWGLRQAWKNHSHGHSHGHLDHGHHETELTPWVLFLIFVLGPCEPLIPLVLYPAVQASVINVVLVTVVFGIATLTVMVTVVLASSFGLKRLFQFPFLERWGTALAGGIICSCGLGIQFLGL